MHQQRLVRWLAAVAAILATLTLVGSPATAAPHSDTGGPTRISADAAATAATGGTGRCDSVELPVRLADGFTTIAGTLCTPKRYAARGAVDVLVHGATYSGLGYWNLSGFSYVEQAMRSGSKRDPARPTFYYDSPGVGRSHQLHSDRVGADAQAAVLAQVVGWLRVFRHYHVVNVVGHSLGSLTAIQTTATYSQAWWSPFRIDGLVLTGLLHTTGVALTQGELQVWPADQDPAFKGRGLDNGWSTTVPNTRGAFHHPGAPASLLAADEKHKAIVSGRQRSEASAQRSVPPSADPKTDNLAGRITGRKVTVVAGQLDRLYCVNNVQGLDCSNLTEMKAYEAKYYHRATGLNVVIVAGAGHDVTLDRPAAAFAAIDAALTR